MTEILSHIAFALIVISVSCIGIKRWIHISIDKSKDPSISRLFEFGSRVSSIKYILPIKKDDSDSRVKVANNFIYIAYIAFLLSAVLEIWIFSISNNLR